MKNKHKKIYTASLIFIAILVFLLYEFSIKAYPVAAVGLSPILAKNLDQAYSLALKLDPKVSKKIVLDQLIKSKEKSKLASVNNQVIEDEYNFLTSKQAPNQDKRIFTEFIVKPQAYDARLRIKYNSDFSANQQAYAKAQDVLDELNSGKTFDELAKTSSDDKVSGQVGGDLGFIKDGQILPELFRAATSSKLGEINKQIVVSRLGYHILYPVETGEKDGVKYWHIKHILIKTEGYEPWLSAQLKDFKVWYIVRI